ncbi:hypothetical protein PoB_002284900 [Plakobranchus ocellatus]|uniref:Uncharacterized protein n=1 Tax=Plakobranchus ocellatus TaxID=259542 RepID=A0AAV3ZM00_9GAST|nr:hypothetical protein PoB_002284900 [Plakobranchus ocellatus]
MTALLNGPFQHKARVIDTEDGFSKRLRLHRTGVTEHIKTADFRRHNFLSWTRVTEHIKTADFRRHNFLSWIRVTEHIKTADFRRHNFCAEVKQH